MRYCTTCGTLNDTDAKFCSGCGKPFANAPDKPMEEFSSYMEPNEPEIYTQEESYYTQPQPVTPILPPQAKTFGIISFVFGLIVINWNWVAFLPIAGQIVGAIFLVMAILGIVFSSKALKISSFRLAKAGRILCIIGLVFLIIFLIVGIAALVSGVYEEAYEYLEEAEQFF